MHQLVSEMSSKLGISEETAQRAVEMMCDYLKAKLPPPFVAHLESMLCAGTAVEGTAAEGAPAESRSEETGIGGMVGKLFK